MKPIIGLTLLALLISGCSYKPTPVAVTGQSGKQYSAPDLCTALVACKNAQEEACYYNSTVQTDVQGTKEESTCKEVKKK